MLEVAESAISRLCQILTGVVGMAIVLMMLGVAADVTMKYVFTAPIYGTSEVVGNYLMIAIVFLSIPVVEFFNRSIYVDLFYNMLSRHLKLFCLFCVYLAQVAFFGVLGYQSWFDAWESLAKREIVDGVVTLIIWPSRFFLLVGFALAFLISALRLIQVLARDPSIESLLDTSEGHLAEKEM